jgi:hypothetical protein
MATDLSEKITSIEAQISQLENRRKELIQKNRELERKARTKRLIERGAIVESLIGGVDHMTNDEFMSYLRKALRTEYIRQPAVTTNAETDLDNESEP